MISTLILVVTLSSTALAWGNNGHQATGIVAQSFLDQKTTGTVSSLLNQVDSAFNGQLTLGTLWADKVKFGKYRWSSTYHYAASVDDFKAGKCSYKDIRDCPDGKCVVGAISNYTRRMECKIRNNKLDLDRAEAVLFVAHFVGDIAQPLHVCARERGGNDNTAYFKGSSSKNLHSVWDSAIVDKRIKDDFAGNLTSYTKFLVNNIKKGMYSKDAEGWIAPVAFNFTVVNEIGHWVVPISWAQESNELDCSFVWPAFDKDPTQDLSLDYYQNAFPLVDRAISKAGYRMAAVMNKALENC